MSHQTNQLTGAWAALIFEQYVQYRTNSKGKAIVSSLNIAICGGGIGGLSAAIALRQIGHDVSVFEKTRAFNRVGADINLTPNAVFAVDRLGVGDVLRETAARPAFRGEQP